MTKDASNAEIQSKSINNTILKKLSKNVVIIICFLHCTMHLIMHTHLQAFKVLWNMAKYYSDWW